MEIRHLMILRRAFAVFVITLFALLGTSLAASAASTSVVSPPSASTVIVAEDDDDDSEDDDDDNTGLVIGGIAGLGVVGTIIWRVIRRKAINKGMDVHNKRRRQHDGDDKPQDYQP